MKNVKKYLLFAAIGTVLTAYKADGTRQSDNGQQSEYLEQIQETLSDFLDNAHEVQLDIISQDDHDANDELVSLSARNKFIVGVHAGTDIGAAMPVPLGEALGSNDIINFTPCLKPGIGISLTRVINNRWSATLETTYKTVALDAIAWVENQTFYDRNSEPPVWISFRGTTKIEMTFPMIEVPLFARYTFKEGGSRILLGGYYARVINAKFLVAPQKGMLFNVVEGIPDYENPRGFISPDAPYIQNFSDAMSMWDAGVMMGYEQRIFSPRLLLSGRFSMGYNNIFHKNKRYLDFKMQHLRGTLTLSYLFFNK